MSEQPRKRDETTRPEGGADRAAEPAQDAEHLRAADLIAAVEREGPLGRERVARIIGRLAAEAEAHETELEDGLREGVDFIAPERIAGEPADERADVYSLAGLAYFLLTGAEPFAGQGPAEKRDAHLTAARPRPSRVRSSVPMAVDRVIARGLAIDPGVRYPTPAEFARALEQALGGHTRRRALAGTAGILAVMAAIAAAIVLTAPEPREKPPPPSVTVTPIPTGEGPWAVARGEGRVWVVNRVDRTLTSIDPKRERPDASVELGADVNPVAVEAAFGAVWVVDRAGGTLLRLSGADPTEPPLPILVGRAPSDVVASDDALWVAVEGEGVVARVDPETNTVDATVDLDAAPRAIAYEDGGVWVVSRRHGAVARIGARTAALRRAAELPGRPTDVAVAHGKAWVSDEESDVVHVLDAGRLEPVAEPIEVGDAPQALAAGNRWIWVAVQGDNNVARIDGPRTRLRGRPILVGNEPADIALGFDSAWTADYRSGRASRIRFPDRGAPNGRSAGS